MSGEKPTVKLAFQKELVTVAIDRLVPTKAMRHNFKNGKKYSQILTSIKAVGVVEPPAIIQDSARKDMYLLLDGHLRIEALRDMGESFARCLIATDDEAYSYNKRMNRLSATQEHRMVVQALDRGARTERIAESLGLDASTIKRRSQLMHGICPEVAELLKDAPCPLKAFDILKQMKPLRQIAAAEIMVGQGNYSAVFAKTILMASRPEDLVERKQQNKKVNGAEQLARMEQELIALQSQVKVIEDSYGLDNLHLTLAQAYLKKLLGNARVVRWLAKNKPEYFEQFQSIAEITVLPS